MELLADYNPLTGERCVIKTEGGKIHITNEQDVTPILDYATELRNNEGYSHQERALALRPNPERRDARNEAEVRRGHDGSQA
jgi:hypothetical protein